MKIRIKETLIGMVVIILAHGLPAASQVTGAYEGDAAVSGVTVSGRAIFSGSMPKPERLPVHRDSVVCGMTMPNEALLVDRASHGVAAVVISLEGVTKGKPLSKELNMVLENRACRFVSRVSATTVGSTLEIRNTDSILHNTHVRRENKLGPTVINVAQPVGTSAILKPLHVVGFMDVRCDAHTFMRAAIHVFEHPYFAVTDQAGRYELPQVPPGSYRLRMWHEAVGVRTKNITVPATGSLTVDLELNPEE